MDSDIHQSVHLVLQLPALTQKQIFLLMLIMPYVLPEQVPPRRMLSPINQELTEAELLLLLAEEEAGEHL